MDTFMQIISQPFTWGLLVGLFLLGMVWRLMRKDIIMLRNEKKRLQEENQELQGHLNTQLKISAKGNDQLEGELKELREQNETLRGNLNLAKQKPGRAELRHLQAMEHAVSVMREQAPGFAQAWEKAMRDAEAAEQAAAGGLKKLMRKVLPGTKFIPAIAAEENATPAKNEKNESAES
jgi:predicted RNase H-like nuclease (RuvC/YqgF family)